MAYATQIPIRTRSEVDAMREAGRHVGEILLELRRHAKPGTRTRDFHELAMAEISSRGLTSSFVGYGPGGLPPYPAGVCVSVNEEIVHGIPGSRKLKSGDIVSLDFGAICDGFHGDSAVTVPVGSINAETTRLVDVTRESLYEGISKMVPGHRLSDIGNAVQKKVEKAGFAVVRQFVGHGIGTEVDEMPQVPNYGKAGRGPRLVAGMVFALEPMVNVGSPGVRMLEDEWTAVTQDGSLSAHFEHTVLVTDSGPEILTEVPGSH